MASRWQAEIAAELAAEMLAVMLAEMMSAFRHPYPTVQVLRKAMPPSPLSYLAEFFLCGVRVSVTTKLHTLRPAQQQAFADGRIGVWTRSASSERMSASEVRISRLTPIELAR